MLQLLPIEERNTPHLVQVFEVGTMTMMNSGVVYPVQDLLKDKGYAVNWSLFF